MGTGAQFASSRNSHDLRQMLVDEPHRKEALLKNGYTLYDSVGDLIASPPDFTGCAQCQGNSPSGPQCPLFRLPVDELVPPGVWGQCPVDERMAVRRIEVHGKTFGWMLKRIRI